jgi:protein SCO1/2
VDTPAQLKGFSDAFNTGPGWLFITGKPEDITSINRKLGDRSTQPFQHRNEIVLGNDATGEWARDSALGDLDRVYYDILEMDPVWRNTPRAVTNDNTYNTTMDLTDRPGEVLFRRVCTPCHTVGVGNRVGPDLRGVTEKRSRDWLHKFVGNPISFTKSGDPDAVALSKAYPNVQMPMLGLSDTDVDDLIAYLKSADERIAQGAEKDEAHTHTHGDHTKSN